MNRRGFLRFLGLAPVGIPAGIAVAATPFPDMSPMLHMDGFKIPGGIDSSLVHLKGAYGERVVLDQIVVDVRNLAREELRAIYELTKKQIADLGAA